MVSYRRQNNRSIERSYDGFQIFTGLSDAGLDEVRVVAEPEKILQAIKAVGHGGANTRQPILPAVGLEVPEVMGSWADRNLF